MKILKKNQIIILVITAMLVTIGYLNYEGENENDAIATSSNSSFGDATLVSSEGLVSNDNILENKIETNTVVETNSEPSKTAEDGYFTDTRLQRDLMDSQNLETYQKILENENTSDEQKTAAANEIKNINNLKNSLMITENLIKTKGFSDVVILINEKSINVVVDAEELDTSEIAQIQNIVTRELKANVEDIHIMNQ